MSLSFLLSTLVPGRKSHKAGDVAFLHRANWVRIGALSRSVCPNALSCSIMTLMLKNVFGSRTPRQH